MSGTTSTDHKARKRHVCDLCGGPILPGQQYTRWRWYGDDTPATVKVHPACRDEASACDWWYDDWEMPYPLMVEWEYSDDPDKMESAQMVRDYWAAERERESP